MLRIVKTIYVICLGCAILVAQGCGGRNSKQSTTSTSTSQKNLSRSTAPTVVLLQAMDVNRINETLSIFAAKASMRGCQIEPRVNVNANGIITSLAYIAHCGENIIVAEGQLGQLSIYCNPELTPSGCNRLLSEISSTAEARSVRTWESAAPTLVPSIIRAAHERGCQDIFEELHSVGLYCPAFGYMLLLSYANKVEVQCIGPGDCAEPAKNLLISF